ncbi:hypothetical protein GS504_24425 [Rhodococcus hoagii]|nr:hypothetical protein [Prescottella equi]NKV70831.1 hypothetical protein [Prescottella equi]
MASIAEIALASGVQPERLDSYLSLIDRTASAAGVSSERVAPIFNRISCADRVPGAELAELARLGIPARQWLSAQMGIPDRLVSATVAEGNVGASTFFAAIANGSGRGGVTAATV